MLTPHLTDRLNEDGTPHIEYVWDGSDMPEGSGVLITGLAKGEVVLADGTRYDVTPDVIEHGPGHAEELAQRIEAQLTANGLLP